MDEKSCGPSPCPQPCGASTELEAVHVFLNLCAAGQDGDLFVPTCPACNYHPWPCFLVLTVRKLLDLWPFGCRALLKFPCTYSCSWQTHVIEVCLHTFIHIYTYKLYINLLPNGPLYCLKPSRSSPIQGISFTSRGTAAPLGKFPLFLAVVHGAERCERPGLYRDGEAG